MPANNRIEFQLDFKTGDIKALSSLKKDLAEIQRMAADPDFTAGFSTKEIQNMITAARTLDSALDQAFDVNLNTVNVQKFNSILAQSGYNAQTLQAGLSQAGVLGQQAFLKLTGQLMQFNTATKQTNKFLDGIATSLFNTIKWSAMSSIVNNVAATVQKSYYYVKDLDRSLNDIRIVTNKSAEDMGVFAEKANEAAKALAVTTEDYTQGSLIYYQQGLDDATVETLTDITAKTSNVTQQSMSTASEQLTAVWNGYQVANRAAEEGMQVYEEYVDKMAAVGASTASDLEELSTAMSKVASAASSMGVDFDDLNAQIATIVSVTRQAPESVGTALKTIYARLGDLKVDGVDEFGTKLGEVSAQLQTMGINIIDQQGNMRNMSDVIAEVAEKWDTWTSAQRQAAAVAMAGKRQYNNLIALFDNQDMYGEALETSMNAAGTLEKQQEIAMDSLANKMDVLKATAEDLYDSLFNTDTISNFLDVGTGVLQFFADFSDSIGGLNNLLPTLGSIGLQVFSDQIGRGLATVVINARNARAELDMMKSNQAALQSMFTNSTFVGLDPETNVHLKEMLGYYQEMSQYQSIMSQEQKEQYKNILETKEAAGSLSVEVSHQKERQEQTYKSITAIKLAENEHLDSTEKIQNRIEIIKNIIKELDDNLEAGNLIAENFASIFSKKVQKNIGLSDEAVKNLVAHLKSAYNVSGDVNTALQQVRNKLQGASDQLVNITAQENKIKSLDNSFKSLGSSLKDNVSTQAFISNITSAIGAFGQLAMSIQTLKNLGNIQSDENLSAGDKMLQIVMNLSFALPGLGLAFKNIGSILAKNEQVMAISNARKAISNALDGTSISLHQVLSKEVTKEQIAKALLDKSLEKEAVARGVIIEELPVEIKEHLAAKAATDAETISTLSLTAALNKLKAVILANPVAATVAAGAALVALFGSIALQAGIAAQEREEAARQARLAEHNSFIEAREEKQQEIKDNRELAESYLDLYALYEKGLTTKEALAEKTSELETILGRERVAVANLTGDYKSLNEELRQYNINKAQEQINQNNTDANEAISHIKNYSGNVFGGNGIGGEAYVINKLLSGDNAEIAKTFFDINYDEANSARRLSFKEGDYTEQQYIELQKILAEIETFSNEQNNKNGQDLDQTNLRELSRQTADINAINRDTEIQQITKNLLTDYNLSNIGSYEEFNNALTEVVNALGKTTLYNEKYNNYDLRFDKALELIGQYSDNNKDYSTRAYATKTITDRYSNKVAKDFDLQKFLSTLDLEDLQYIISGQVVIDKETSEEDIKKQLNAITSDLKNDGSLEIVTSLRNKLTSGKKMTKKELEEALGEKAELANQYTDFSDFDNQSELEQIKTINEVADAEIERNADRLKDAKSIAKEKLEYYEQISKEISKYEINNGTAINNLNEEDMARYKELKEILDEFPMDTIAELRDIKENGLSFEEIDTTVFDNLISGIDGVISEAEVLKSLAEDIGENQTVAADDVARFGKNFPDIIAAEENYVFLQDGSLQLTEKGKEALQETVDAEKAKLIAENENYQLELRRQADIQKATADYYTQQADLLEDYLNGRVSAKDAEKQLEDNTNEYVRKLTELTGKDNEELNRIMQENAGKTAENAQKNTEAIYQYWCSVGETAAKAALAYDSKEFTPPTGPSGKQGPVLTADTSAYQKRDVDKNSQLGSMDTEAIVNTVNSYREMAEKANNKYSEYMSKIADIGAATNASINAMEGAASGKGGKQSKSKSGGSKKDKDQKEQEDEFDRYQEIKKAIDAVDLALKKLDKDQENLFGYELIASLKQENELLEQQAANYNTLYEMQQQEAAELREQLGTMGLMFDASGAITNYAAATSAALQAYAAAIEQYNAGLIDETTLGVYEKSYENFKKLLQRYDTLYYKEMQDTQDKIDEIHRKELANNLKAWETEIQIHLDMEKAKRDQNEFLKDITKDFRKVYQDLTIDVNYDEDNFKSIVNDVNTTIRAIHDVQSEIDKMMGGGTSDMFESVSQAQEKLKELQEELLSQGKDLYALYKAVQEAYLEGMDQVKDQFDELMNKYKRFDNELKFQKELIELLYGDKAYELMDKYYKVQEQNILAQIESLRKQTSMWESEFQKSYQNAIKNGSKVDIDDFTTWTEDMKKAYENMIESQEDLNDLILEAVKILQDQYLNSINKIMDAMDKEIWGKDGFEGMKKNQEFMQKMADEYLDAVEGGAKIQLFANRIDMDKANTSNLKAQQKLQAFRDKEIKDLREKENLTQADIDLAEARYQIMLKEIALEDAQNNKTSMKLTRNEQGNQSYQYVADEDEVGQKQQDLLQSYSDLYKLADDSFAHSMELAFDLYEEVRDRIREIAEDTTLTEEEKNRKIAEIQKQYSEQINIALGNAELYRQEAMQATAGVFQTICEQDASAYETLTEEQKRMVDELKDLHFEDYNEMRDHLKEDFLPSVKEVFEEMNINSQTTAAQFLKDQVKDPNSVKNSMIKAVSEIQKAIQEYEKELDKLQQIADMDFSKIGESIDKVSKKIEDMGGTTDRMVDNSSQYLDELRRTLEAVASTWDSVIEKILESQRAMQEYINLAAQARAASNAGSGGNTGGGGIPPVGGGNGSGDNGNKAPEGPGGKGERFGIIAQDGHHNVDTRIDSAGEKGLTLDEAHNLYSNNKMLQGAEGLSNFRFQNLDKNAGFPAYKTGGYTGAWNDSDGRLAMLHQKELVLNADDTKNFLSGISMIRDMTSMNGSISKAITNAVGNMVYALNNTSIGVRTNPAGQEAAAYNTYNITAEFPNANDVNEIREAILSLPNLASQYIGRNIK